MVAGIEDARFMVSKQFLRNLKHQRTTINDDGCITINVVHCSCQVRNANWKKK